jgi:hypothetical protein
MRGLLSIIALCTAVCAVPIAHAEPRRETLPSDWRERVVAAELTDTLTHEARKAYEWRVLWTAANAALAVGSMAGVAVLPESERASSIVGSIAAGLSAASVWAWPLEVESAAETATRLTNLNAKDRVLRLSELYERSAADELERQHWTWHLVNLALSLVPGAILWLGYKQPTDAALTTVSGFVLGELTLFSQPTGLVDRRMPSVSVTLSRRGGALWCAFRW